MKFLNGKTNNKQRIRSSFLLFCFFLSSKYGVNLVCKTEIEIAVNIRTGYHFVEELTFKKLRMISTPLTWMITFQCGAILLLVPKVERHMKITKPKQKQSISEQDPLTIFRDNIKRIINYQTLYFLFWHYILVRRCFCIISKKINKRNEINPPN